jgi:aspartate/glutamate racemase
MDKSGSATLTARSQPQGRWFHVLGIVGGLGPHAHIEFERRLLAAVGSPSSDPEYPEWILCSVSQTPDRTAALLEGGASPMPALVVALERLAGWAVMRPIYGPPRDGRRLAGGIKSGGDRDPETGRLHREALADAVCRLAKTGAACVVTGCTEIPIALGREAIDGTPLLDPRDLCARTAVRIARGELPLPKRRRAPR